MEGILTHVEGGRLLIKFSREIFEKDALLAAAYMATKCCTVLIEPIGEKELGVIFEPKGEIGLSNLEGLARDFCNQVLDQQLRLNLDKRYGNIRELIVQHAFSPLKDLEERLNKK